jgi:hypothetical protein
VPRVRQAPDGGQAGGEPTHGEPQEHPSVLPASGSAEAPRGKKPSEALKKSAAHA